MIFGRGGSPEPPWRLKLARLPLSLAASPRSFTFYLADPSARLRSCNGCEATARLSIASTCLIEPLWWRACRLRQFRASQPAPATAGKLRLPLQKILQSGLHGFLL